MGNLSDCFKNVFCCFSNNQNKIDEGDGVDQHSNGGNEKETPTNTIGTAEGCSNTSANESPLYFIRNKNSNMYLDAKGGGESKGTGVILWTFHGQKNQQWFWEPSGIIRNAANNLVLDVCKEVGPNVHLWEQNDKSHQLWEFRAMNIVSKRDGRVLQVYGSSLNSGASLIVSQPLTNEVSYAEKKSQEWEILEVSKQKISQLLFYIYSPEASKVKDPSSSRFFEAVPAMFFSWIAYKNYIDPEKKVNQAAAITGCSSWMIGTKYDQNVDKRLSGFGRFVITNEYHYEHDVFNTHAIVADNVDYGLVIIAFRGTESDWAGRINNSINDWVQNFRIEMARYKKDRYPDGDGGKVHRLMYEAYRVISEGVREQIKKYMDMNYRVVITGHSKGGATATFCMLDIMEEFGDPKKQLHLITFGSPRCGENAFAKHFAKVVPQESVHHYVTSFAFTFAIIDVITELPPHTQLFPFTHVHGTRTYIKANENYFGNPMPIRSVKYQGSRALPLSLNVHYQQCYMDGLLFEETSDCPFIVSGVNKAIASLGNKILGDLDSVENEIKIFWNNIRDLLTKK